MIRKANEQILEKKCIRGGHGEVLMQKLLNGPDEMYGKGRMFNRMTLLPGDSIGEHSHSGDNEIFYILSGKGLYTDNGVQYTVEPGDVLVCGDGDSHAMVNETSEPIEFVALILYS